MSHALAVRAAVPARPAGTGRDEVVLMTGERDESSPRQLAFALAGVGMTNAVAALLGAAAGWFVDSRTGTAPLFILIGMVLGLAGGVATTWREVSSYLGNSKGRQ